MHLDQSALGILRKAEDKNGRKYMDWRIPYMDQPGLIMVYKSDSRYEKYQVYFFTSPASDCPGKYLHTTLRKYPGGRWFIDNQNKEQRL